MIKKFVFILSFVFTVLFFNFSVFANIKDSKLISECPFSVDDIFNSSSFKSAVSSLGWDYNSSNSKVFITKYYSSYFIKIFSNNISYLKEGSASSAYVYLYNKNDENISVNVLAGIYSNGSFNFYSDSSSSKSMADFNAMLNDSDLFICDNSTVSIFNKDNTSFFVFDDSSSLIEVSHTFNTNTSAVVNFNVNYGFPYKLYYSLSGVDLANTTSESVSLRYAKDYIPGTSVLTVAPDTDIYYVLNDINGLTLHSDIYHVPVYDAVISNSDKDIEYSVEYSSDNLSATISVNVVNGTFNDNLFYSEYANPLNDSFPKFKLNSSTLTINKNCIIYLLLYDNFDNLICSKSVKIDEINSISDNNFKINIVKEDNSIYLYPRLYNVLQSKYYNIEFDYKVDKFVLSKDIKFFKSGSLIGNAFDFENKNFELLSDEELKFIQDLGSCEITCNFRVRNKETNDLCVTKVVTFKISPSIPEQTGVLSGHTEKPVSSSSSGSSSPVVSDDTSFIVSDEYSSSSNNYNLNAYSNLSSNTSLSEVFESTQGGMAVVQEAFSILPGWLWGFVSIGLVVAITLRILGR